jgi:hypothetical protein
MRLPPRLYRPGVGGRGGGPHGSHSLAGVGTSAASHETVASANLGVSAIGLRWVQPRGRGVMLAWQIIQVVTR